MKSSKLFYGCIVFIVLITFIIWVNSNLNYKEPSSEKIDSLKNELSIIDNKRDSIQKEIDTIIIELEKNENEYKKAYNTIIFNSSSEDYVFFSKYIKWNRERLDSLDNN